MKRNYKTIILIVCVFIVTQIVNLTKAAASSNSERKNKILILQSYQRGNEWEDGIFNGIQAVINKEDTDVQVEYMDSNKYSGENYEDKLFEFYSFKYRESSFDSIITCDYNALNFMIKYGKRLFQGVPVVFCGVDNSDISEVKDNPLYTGLTITEDINIRDTFSVALKLQNKAKDLVVIVDNSPEGIKIKNIINTELNDNFQGRKIIFIEDNKIEDVLAKVKKLSTSSIIFFSANLMDKDGIIISTSKAVRLLSKNSSMPIYSSWGMMLNNGIVGGKFLGGKEYGKNVAAIVQKILNGEDVSKIPITKTDSDRYMFDYNMLKKYKLDSSLVPPNSIIINKPFYKLSVPQKYGVIFFLVTVFILTAIILILLFNINRRKRAEKALREEQERLRTVLNATPDIICFKNYKGEWQEANESTIKVFKLENIDYKGKDNKELSEMTEFCKETLINGYKSDEVAWQQGRGSISRFEEIIPFSTNEERIYDMVKVPIFNGDNTPKALVIMGRDITDQKKAEKLKLKAEEDRRLLNEAMEYDKIKTEFFANISHELRTPLNVMFSTVQLLDLYIKNELIVDKGANIEKKTYILRQNCFRLLRLVNNLIDITKIDSGYFQIELQNYNIVSVIEEITLSVAEYIENKGINLIFDTDIEEKIMAVDAEKIERIMLNLLSNAIKFTPAGKEIFVNIHDKGDAVLISVKDTGIGIPKEKQNIIFERFRQVDKSLTRRCEGSGIGLSLVKSLVEMHEGSVSVDSEPGSGSEFIISMPVKVISNKIAKISEYNIGQENIEKINLEFSDIYS